MADFAMFSSPSLRQRLAWRLGFDRRHNGMDLIDWSNAETPGFSPGSLCTDVNVHLDFGDRMRLLLTGWLEVEVRTKTDGLVNKAKSLSGVRILSRKPSHAD